MLMRAVTPESLPVGLLMMRSPRNIVLIVRLSGGTAVIKLIVITSAIAMLAAAAQAQVSPFGGPIPFIVNPYPLYGPGQTTDSGPDSRPSDGEHCGPVYSGRGGVRYPCADEDQREHRR
jgi:hypothetical protein